MCIFYTKNGCFKIEDAPLKRAVTGRFECRYLSYKASARHCEVRSESLTQTLSIPIAIGREGFKTLFLKSPLWGRSDSYRIRGGFCFVLRSNDAWRRVSLHHLNHNSRFILINTQGDGLQARYKVKYPAFTGSRHRCKLSA